MAAGYARASGQVGVCMVTSGPGATNMVTPVRDCAADSVPIVVICGQVATAAIGTDAFQEAPVAALMGAVAKHVFLVTDPERLEITVRTAFEIARTGRPGPVVIDIPKDVQNWNGVFAGSGTLEVPGYRARLAALDAAHLGTEHADELLQYLRESQRPLIYVGGGVINAGAAAELNEFAQLHGIPVVTTLMGIGAIDTTHPLAMRMLGMHGAAYANYAVEDCDLLIAVGARFDDRVAGNPQDFARGRGASAISTWTVPRSTRSWRRTGRMSACCRRRCASCASARARRACACDYAAWRAHLAALREKHAMNYNRASELVQPHYVIEEINRMTKGEAIISTGVGQHQMWAAQMFDFARPRQWLTSGSMGTMGFGLPAAIGAQVAHPGRLVIDIDGDASIRMNIGELETATTYDLPVKVVVLNNFGDGMVRQWQKLFFKGRLSGSDKSLHKKDFVKAAQADGFQYAQAARSQGRRAGGGGGIPRLPGTGLPRGHHRPRRGRVPDGGAGPGLRGMITGDYIPSRAQARGRGRGRGSVEHVLSGRAAAAARSRA